MAAVTAPALSADYLRTEHLANPSVVGPAKPHLSWELASGGRDEVQTAYRILVATKPSLLVEGKTDLWDSGKKSSDATFDIEYDGKPLPPHGQAFWKVMVWDLKGKSSKWSKVATWGVGPGTWEGSEWIGADWLRSQELGLKNGGDGKVLLYQQQLLFSRFSLRSKPVRAVVYATALGWADVHVNGARINESFFDPGWTDYRKRVYYRAYDVTGRLKQGENVLGARLGDGWFSGYIGWDRKRDHYGKSPRFRAILHVEYADGSSEQIGTGPNWVARPDDTYADILHGQTTDATVNNDNWDSSGSAFEVAPVVTGAEVNPVIEPHPGPPVTALHEIPVESVTEPKPGVYIFKLNQYIAGVCRLKVKGQPGQKIVLRHIERLNPDGTAYVTNLRSARATDTYICRGGGTEVWTPRFTFHGFQYVEVTGLTSKPSPDTITGLALSSATPDVGTFESGDAMLNRLSSNVYYTQLANFIDVPTDCPQRDERLGWTGDAQAYIRTATLNADVQSFFTKWLVDLDDSQRADGQFPMVAPLIVAEGDGGPAWADAGVICPWTVYQVYGDKRQLAAHYPNMVRYVEFCRARSKPDLSPPDQFHCFGDWVNIGDDTPTPVIYTAYFALSTKIVAQAAEALGKTDDAAKYTALYEKVRQVFQAKFVKPDGTVGSGSQTSYVLALGFDLLPSDLVKPASDKLVANIEAHNWHLTTGFVGTKDLMLTLSKIGLDDVALRLVHNETFPSWGFTIKNGATSIWERWDGWTPEKGFQDPGMNSFAHYAFGAVYQWMAEHLGGIKLGKTAYKHIVLEPLLDPKSGHATVTYRSIRGLIKSAWAIQGKRVNYEFTVPPNTTATIRVAAASGDTVRLDGKASPGKLIDGKHELRVGSGTYRFTVATQ